MPGISEFIQTFMGMRDLQLRREAAQTNRRAQEAQTTLAGVAQFLQLAQASPDPVSQRALSKVFADRGVAPEEVLNTMLAGVAPNESTLRAYSARQGMLRDQGVPNNSLSAATDRRNREAADRVGTGMSSAEAGASDFLAKLVADASGNPLSEGYRTRLATGLSQGEQALSVGLANLPAEQQAQRAMIAAGTAQSAAQDANNQLGWASHRLNERQLLSTSALGQINAAIDQLRANKSGSDHLPELFGTKQRLLEQIQSNRQRLTPAVLQGYIGAFNAINQQLSEAGIANEGQIPYDPKLLVDPGMFESFLNRFKGGPTSGNLQPFLNPTLKPPPGGTR